MGPPCVLQALPGAPAVVMKSGTTSRPLPAAAGLTALPHLGSWAVGGQIVSATWSVLEVML